MKPLARLVRLTIAGALALASANSRGGDDMVVPGAIQARLLSKIILYDRNLPRRVHGVLRVGFLARPKSPLAAQAAGQLRQALSETPKLGGFPHEILELPFTRARDVAFAARAHDLAVLYVMPGLSEAEVRELAQALEGLDILTVAAASSDVQNGMVVGFDLASGRPKIKIHLKQARRQNVDFSADLLKLTEVVE